MLWTELHSRGSISCDTFCFSGNDGLVKSLKCSGVREAEIAGSGSPAMPGESVAPGWTCQYSAETAEKWAVCGSAGGRKETSRIHESIKKIRRRYFTISKFLPSETLKAPYVYMCCKSAYFTRNNTDTFYLPLTYICH